MSDRATARALKLSLLGGIAALALPGVSLAQDTSIETDQTTPVVTSTDGNVTVTSDGSVTVTTGPAVTIDSDNTVAIDGTIGGGSTEEDDGDGGTESVSVDGAGGVLITNDATFTYTQTGTINLIDDRGTTVDALTDGTVEDELAPDFGDDRYGFRIAAGTFTGDVTFDSTATINIAGDSSFGVAIDGDLTGDVIIDGDINMRGEDSTAVHLAGDLTGDVTIGALSSIGLVGVDSNAVEVSGDIDGALTFGGTILATGYTDLSPDSETDDETTTDDDAQVAAAIAENNVQRGLTSGHGILIAGSVTDGVLVDGSVSGDFIRIADSTDDANVTTNVIVTTTSANVTVVGSGNALRVDGGTAGLTLGIVDTSDVIDATQTITDGLYTGLCPVIGDSEADPTAASCASYGSYGLINRGQLTADGRYSEIAATTAYIGNATIDGGFRNDGTISAVATSAMARGLVVGDGASIPTLVNAGRISASTLNGDAVGLTIEGTASVPTLRNANRIEVQAIGDDNDATAILDTSGSVTSFTNSGFVTALQRNETDEPDESADPQTIAMDFSANTAGITIHNTVRVGYDEDDGFARSVFGNVTGDVYTGTGDDIYRTDAGTTAGDLYLNAGNDLVDLALGAIMIGDIDFGTGDGRLVSDDGSLAGDLTFGAGSHSIELNNGSIFRGLINATGALDIAVTGSSLLLTNVGTLTLSSLNLASSDDVNSVLGVAVTEDGSALTRINADSISIGDGTEIRTLFSRAFASFGEDDSDTLEGVILSSANTTIDVDALQFNLEGNSPVLFEQSVRRDETNPNDIILTMRRKDASELGLGRGLEAAFDPVIVALAQDEALGAALFNTTTNEEFQNAFNQIVAGPLDAPLAYARAQNSSVTSLISQRVDMLGERDDATKTAWLQQQSYFIDRESTTDSNGFDGGGFVIAGGADIALGGLDVIGIAAHIASARYDEQLGEDFPFNRLSYGVDLYAAEDFGDVEIDGRIGYAVSDSDSERNVVFGGERRQLVGEWEGTQMSANGRIRYRKPIGEKYEVVPFASVDYISIEEDAYIETGDDILALEVDDREATSVRGNVGVSLGRIYNLRPSAYDTGIPGTIVPRLTVGYSHEFSDEDIDASYRFNGGETFTLMSEPEGGAAIVGADVDYENQYTRVSLGVSGAFGDQVNAYTLRVGIGLKW